MQVLNHDNQAMREFDTIPTTISSATTGWLYEAWMRVDPRKLQTRQHKVVS